MHKQFRWWPQNLIYVCYRRWIWQQEGGLLLHDSIISNSITYKTYWICCFRVFMLIVIRYQCNQSIFLGFIVILDIMLQVNVQRHLNLVQRNIITQNTRHDDSYMSFSIILYRYIILKESLHLLLIFAGNNQEAFIQKYLISFFPIPITIQSR